MFSWLKAGGFTLTRLIKTVDVDRFSKNVSFPWYLIVHMRCKRSDCFNTSRFSLHRCSRRRGTTEKKHLSDQWSSSSSVVSSSQNLNSSLRSGFGNGDLKRNDKRKIETQTQVQFVVEKLIREKWQRLLTHYPLYITRKSFMIPFQIL